MVSFVYGMKYSSYANFSRMGSMPASLVVPGFAKGEGDVAIFDHMLNLSPHYMFKLSEPSSYNTPAPYPFSQTLAWATWP